MTTQDAEDDEKKSTLAEKIGGLGQKIIGEIEEIGGVLTADGGAQTEGEFNVEVGTIRQKLEDIEDKG